jgi:hypothetical protein
MSAKLRNVFAFAAVAGVAVIPSAQAMTRAPQAVRMPQTTTPDTIDEVDVTITDSKIILSDKTAERGDQVDFHVTNNGKRAHNFVLVGTGPVALSNLGLGTNLLRPHGTAVLQVFMDFRGPMTYKSTVRVDLTKPGMKGTFAIL